MNLSDTHVANLSINFHLIEVCNAHCAYCFATFPHLKKRDRLSFEDQKALIDAMVDAGVRKINFAGGEPTLVKNLGTLCERIKYRSEGRCAVSIVSNGARLRALIENSSKWIDWVALSVDSADDAVNTALGRARAGSPYAANMMELGDQLKDKGIQLKCNTVVSRANVNEDMRDFIEKLSPRRWKLFQVLPVEGENDAAIDNMTISDEEFQKFVNRHEPLREFGVEIVPENNSDMTNSYLMIGPDGRFFWHVTRGGKRTLKYGDPILEVGFERALKQVQFSNETFRSRGGEYDWLRNIPVEFRGHGDSENQINCI